MSSNGDSKRAGLICGKNAISSFTQSQTLQPRRATERGCPRDADALLEMPRPAGSVSMGGDRSESLVAAKLVDDQGLAACAGALVACCRRAPRNRRRAEQGRELGAPQARVGTYTVTNAPMGTMESHINLLLLQGNAPRGNGRSEWI
jgi:hypothetical protein